MIFTILLINITSIQLTLGATYPSYETEEDCRGCHGNDTSNRHHLLIPNSTFQCTDCHIMKYNNQTQSYYPEVIRNCLVCHPGKNHDDCVSCHVDGEPGDVNRSAFSQGVHIDINTTEGHNSLNKSDCWTCHFDRNMNKSNILQCEDCHTESGVQAVQAPIVRTHLSAVTKNSCNDCHSKVMVPAGQQVINVTSHYLLRPIVPTKNYCDYCHGPNASSPFSATNKIIPAFNHDDPSWNSNATCRTCHSNSSVFADPLANDTSSFHDLTTELGDVNGPVKADCILCHVQKLPQFVDAPMPQHDISGYDTTDCSGCHTSGTGTEPQKLHDITAFATGGCIACHSNSSKRWFVDTSLFGMHANVNSVGGINNVTDDDCKTCHFGSVDGSMKMKLGTANYSNTYFCDDCHVSGGRNPKEYANISSPYRKDGLSHGSTNCQWCHIAGDSLSRPLDSALRYHPNGPRGTAAGKNCLTCHYYANLPDLPFHAPGEVHESDVEYCGECHDQADNHVVSPLNSNTPPSISGLFINNSPVFAGIPIQIEATVNDDMTKIAVAQYQIRNDSIIIKEWTNMIPKDGLFDWSNEVVDASIDTSSLLGTYTVDVKGMASAYKTSGGPYYPLNGQWSGVYNIGFIVKQAEGYDNGTVYGPLGVKLAGAKVSTDTGMSTITNEIGFYSLNLTNGTYHLTVSKEPEYYVNNNAVVTVKAFITTTQDIILDAKPTGTISGIVKNK